VPALGPITKIAAGFSKAERANSFGLGDYMGITIGQDYLHNEVFYPVWADNSNSTGNNPDGRHSQMDLYTSKVLVQWQNPGAGPNNPPVGSNGAISTLENTPYTFSPSDFNFSDPDNSPQGNFLAVEISDLPTFGTLFDDGQPVVAGQFVPETDIFAGGLVYDPPADTSGPGLDWIIFQYQNDGGTANGGVDTDATPRTMTINVTPPPTVTSLSQTSGPTVGTYTIDITGINFTGASAVTFGGVAATSVTVNSNTSITAGVPAQAPGTVDVTVTTPGGTSATAPADQFTYLQTPAVTSLSQTSGPMDGGYTIDITGTGFTGATAVTFDHCRSPGASARHRRRCDGDDASWHVRYLRGRPIHLRANEHGHRILVFRVAVRRRQPFFARLPVHVSGIRHDGLRERHRDEYHAVRRHEQQLFRRIRPRDVYRYGHGPEHFRSGRRLLDGASERRYFVRQSRTLG